MDLIASTDNDNIFITKYDFDTTGGDWLKTIRSLSTQFFFIIIISENLTDDPGSYVQQYLNKYMHTILKLTSTPVMV